MILDKLKYIGFYTTSKLKNPRYASMAACNKMDYTISALKRVARKIEIVSPAKTKYKEKQARGQIIEINSNIDLKVFRTLPAFNKLMLMLNQKLINIQLLYFLLLNTSKKEPILVYHSLVTSKIILLAKRIKNFKLILEVNEIYSDVSEKNSHHRQTELNCIHQADAFIFPNNLMDKLFNLENKPSLVEYGVYKANKIMTSKFQDGKTHVVYAGTFELSKGGAIKAIQAAKFLSKDYHLHILGFGTKEEVCKVNNEIKTISSKSECSISYDGLLQGDEFQLFLQKCHIGLSTQLPNQQLNDTSFPSKILNYLANGLQVVSVSIPAITNSELAADLYLYKDSDPKVIAETIMSVSDFTPKFKILESLDKRFKSELVELFKKLTQD